MSSIAKKQTLKDKTINNFIVYKLIWDTIVYNANSFNEYKTLLWKLFPLFYILTLLINSIRFHL